MYTQSRVDDRRRVSNCTIIAAETARTVSKSQTVLLSVHSNHHFLCNNAFLNQPSAILQPLLNTVLQRPHVP